jgi:Ca-activated chloride channel homolog
VLGGLLVRIVPLALLIAFSFSPGQTGNQETSQSSLPLGSISSDAPVKDAWPEIDVNVLVLDKANEPLAQAIPPNFQLTQDGTPQAISSVTGPNDPASFCFLIDTSGSTRPIVDAVREAVSELLHGLPRGSEVMSASFADEPYLDLHFTPVSSADPSRFLHLDSRGGTAMLDAIIATENYFVTHAHFQRRALVLISDGGENASHRSIDEAIRAMLAPGAPMFYALKFAEEGSSPDSASERARDGQRLKALATKSGGLIFSVNKDKDASSETERILAAIRDQYALTYVSTETAEDGQLHKLDVQIPGDSKQLRIYGLPAYYAP